MSGNITKQDAKAGLKQCYRLICWPDSQDAESQWKMNQGMADAAYLAWSHLSVTYQRSQHSHLCQPASPAPLSTDMPTHNPDTV